MKKLIVGLVIGVLAGFAAAHFIRPSGPAVEKSEAGGARPEEQEAENPLHLAQSVQAAAGIKLATPQSASVPPETDAFGRVLDPTPFVSLVAEEATARASLEASEKALERTRKLYAAGANASAQAVETAEAAAVRDRAAVESVHVRLLAGWGKTLADHADLATIRDTLAGGAALIRIDLLPGTQVGEGPKSARVELLGGGDSYDVEILGPAPIADPQVQGASFLALLRGHTLPAGATLHATVAAEGAPTEQLTIPRSAVVYHQGSAWVYVLEKENFTRKLVTLGRSVDDQVVIAQGLAKDDRVAIAGAQQLLAAELTAGAEVDER
jgi:hypothetical protein